MADLREAQSSGSRSPPAVLTNVSASSSSQGAAQSSGSTALKSTPNESASSTSSSSPNDTPFVVALAAGGCAGTAVDVSLYPIDTIKTRLQAKQGFWKSGGFRGVYSGLGAAAIVRMMIAKETVRAHV